MERTAKAGIPLTLTVWISDDAKFTSSSGARPKDPGDPVTVKWTRYRGQSGVTFASDRPAVEKVDRKGSTAPFNGKATTSVTFAEPGEYVLHLTANDLFRRRRRGIPVAAGRMVR